MLIRQQLCYLDRYSIFRRAFSFRSNIRNFKLCFCFIIYLLNFVCDHNLQSIGHELLDRCKRWTTLRAVNITEYSIWADQSTITRANTNSLICLMLHYTRAQGWRWTTFSKVHAKLLVLALAWVHVMFIFSNLLCYTEIFYICHIWFATQYE